MSAESVLFNVLSEIGLDNKTAQLSSDDYEIRQILAFINAAGKDIANRTEWSRLYKIFITRANTNEAILPEDFQKIAKGSAVILIKPGFHPIRPIVSPNQWQFLYERPSTQHYYHLTEGKILFSPSLGDEGAKVRYVSKNWAGGKDEVSQNGDTLLIPERLVEKGTIYRWKRQKGMPFDDVLAEFEADLMTEINADRGVI